MDSSPGTAPGEAAALEADREWHRPLALVVLLLSAWVVGPILLVAVPFVLMVVGLPVRRPGALLAAAVVAGLVVVRSPDGGTLYLELGWTLSTGALFVAFTLLWPRLRVIHRALAAVGSAALFATALFLARPGSWPVVDWRVRDRLMEEVSRALVAFRALQGGDPLPAGLETSVFQSAEVQAHLFPAVLGLTTVAGLALAWWLYSRLAVGERGALGSVREFRFEDQLVWVFITGLLLVAVTAGDGWTRAGSNTLVFMGALYALRGAAVVLFLSGGLSVLGGVFLAVGMLFLTPILLFAALLIGLGDTWLDVRAKARALLT